MPDSGAHLQSFFQTREWAELFCQCFSGYQPAFIHEGEVTLPLVRQSRLGGLATTYIGMPWMTSTGLVGATEDKGTSWVKVLRRLSALGGLSKVLCLPWWENFPEVEGYTPSCDRTYVLDLRSGWQQTWSGVFTQRGRTAVRRADREGVQVHRVAASEFTPAHWSIVQPYFKAWEPCPEPTLEFIKHASRCSAARCYLAHRGSECVGSLLAFAGVGETFAWQGARRQQDAPGGTFNLLLTKAAEEACNEGQDWFNLGSSLGNAGIESFKTSFGAEAKMTTVLKYRHPLLYWVRRNEAQGKHHPKDRGV